jgi:chromosomal replication initiation ATPase DnaA
LKERIRPDLFERWFLRLHGEFCDNDLVVTAPDRFHAAFVEDNYSAFLLEMARRLVGLNGRLCVRVSV